MKPGAKLKIYDSIATVYDVREPRHTQPAVYPQQVVRKPSPASRLDGADRFDGYCVLRRAVCHTYVACMHAVLTHPPPDAKKKASRIDALSNSKLVPPF